MTFLGHTPFLTTLVPVIQGALDFEDPVLQALIEGLPQAPAAARRQCLKMCAPHTGCDDERPQPRLCLWRRSLVFCSDRFGPKSRILGVMTSASSFFVRRCGANGFRVLRGGMLGLAQDKVAGKKNFIVVLCALL